MRIQKVTIVLDDGNIHEISGSNVGRRAITKINLFELAAMAEESYRQRREEQDTRCSGDCSYGGEGPSCNLPGCKG